MANKVTLHFRNDRADRATYIAQTVGFGEIVRTAEFFNRNRRFDCSWYGRTDCHNVHYEARTAGRDLQEESLGQSPRMVEGKSQKELAKGLHAESAGFPLIRLVNKILI